MRHLTYIKEYKKDFNAAPKERKHIILLDGTWNDETGLNGDGLVTNIVNLQRIFKNDPEKQIVRYHRGVGNDNDNHSIGATWKGITGKSIDGIVDKAYARLVQDWQNGDRIYIFGFSRGAAAARILAAKIAQDGIPAGIEITLEPKENKETKVVEQAITKAVIDDRTSKAIDIEFLGVWDTVSAFGLGNNILRFIGVSENDLFTDNHIAPNIQKAVHLVAIDETRNPFVPSLMNHKAGVTHEVWFPGVHSDIGGSYEDDGIAKVSLYYMIKQMKKWNEERKLADFIIDKDNLQHYTKEEIDKAYFHFHGDAAGENLRPICVQVDGKEDKKMKPNIHKLYYDIASQKKSYSVIEDKNGDIKHINFQYMPFNIKVLDNEYKILS